MQIEPLPEQAGEKGGDRRIPDDVRMKLYAEHPDPQGQCFIEKVFLSPFDVQDYSSRLNVFDQPGERQLLDTDLCRGATAIDGRGQFKESSTKKVTSPSCLPTAPTIGE